MSRHTPREWAGAIIGGLLLAATIIVLCGYQVAFTPSDADLAVGGIHADR